MQTPSPTASTPPRSIPRDINAGICSRCGYMAEGELDAEDHLNGSDCLGDEDIDPDAPIPYVLTEEAKS